MHFLSLLPWLLLPIHIDINLKLPILFSTSLLLLLILMSFLLFTTITTILLTILFRCVFIITTKCLVIVVFWWVVFTTTYWVVLIVFVWISLISTSATVTIVTIPWLISILIAVIVSPPVFVIWLMSLLLMVVFCSMLTESFVRFIVAPRFIAAITHTFLIWILRWSELWLLSLMGFSCLLYCSSDWRLLLRKLVFTLVSIAYYFLWLLFENIWLHFGVSCLCWLLLTKCPFIMSYQFLSSVIIIFIRIWEILRDDVIISMDTLSNTKLKVFLTLNTSLRL